MKSKASCAFVRGKVWETLPLRSSFPSRISSMAVPNILQATAAHIQLFGSDQEGIDPGRSRGESQNHDPSGITCGFEQRSEGISGIGSINGYGGAMSAGVFPDLLFEILFPDIDGIKRAVLSGSLQLFVGPAGNDNVAADLPCDL